MMQADDTVPGSQMLAEMSDQPAVLRALLSRADQITAELRRVVPNPLRGIVLVARGSSDNAAVHGRYVLEAAARVPVALAAPSLHTRYGVVPDLDGFLVIGISQSGATPEIVDTVQRLATGGAVTLGITNEADSPLANDVDVALLLDAGTEQAVPATKTFTAQVAAVCLIAGALGELPGLGGNAMSGGWSRAIDAVDEVLADRDAAAETAELLVAAKHVLPVARGFGYAGALEIGLKLAETTGLAVHGTSTADLQHGPIAAVHPGAVALCLAEPGPVAADVAHVAGELSARGATVAAIGSDPSLVPDAASWLRVPTGIPEPLAVLTHVVRGQQLAHASALALGIDPDAPFALNKVTRTT